VSESAHSCVAFKDVGICWLHPKNRGKSARSADENVGSLDGRGSFWVDSWVFFTRRGEMDDSTHLAHSVHGSGPATKVEGTRALAQEARHAHLYRGLVF
jgi:hypothetical protein